MLLEKNPLGRKILFDQARKKTLETTHGHYPAPLRAIEVVRVGIEDGPRAGFDAEARAVAELATSRTAKNLIHVFRLTEEAKKETGLPGAAPREVHSTAVLGAGVMGGGIAQLIAAETDLPVRMKDVRDEALASGMQHASRLFTKQVERRRLAAPEARRKMALLHPTLDYSGFRPVRPGDRGDRREHGGQAGGLRRDGQARRRGRRPRLEHLVAVDRRHRRQDAASGAGGRHALLQSGRTRCRWSR